MDPPRGNNARAVRGRPLTIESYGRSGQSGEEMVGHLVEEHRTNGHRKGMPPARHFDGHVVNDCFTAGALFHGGSTVSRRVNLRCIISRS